MAMLHVSFATKLPRFLRQLLVESYRTCAVYGLNGALGHRGCLALPCWAGRSDADEPFLAWQKPVAWKPLSRVQKQQLFGTHGLQPTPFFDNADCLLTFPKSDEDFSGSAHGPFLTWSPFSGDTLVFGGGKPLENSLFLDPKNESHQEFQVPKTEESWTVFTAILRSGFSLT